MSKQKIVKVQLPLAVSDGDFNRMLVYAKGRKNVREQAPTKAVLDSLNGEPKGFFYARLDGNRWDIQQPAPWQNW